ncbi:TolC family protein [Acetobacter tropicalis]|uniref:Protein CyaE n=1 Tax=Acetobacter tropicalis TaxID=104102 RepID=A0A252A5A1_9PROT|nr:TolC family protein [Acetobacter tropicalis]OUI84609.1 transporter [Acetobacter tropicalis]
MMRFSRPCSTLWHPLALLLLSSCATQALETAPERADTPWQPNVSEKGEILPRKSQTGHGLKIPADFTLPANQALGPRAPDAEINSTHPYSLAELIDIAQSSNPTTRIAWNTARDAALAVGITRTAYLPHLSATVVGGYTHQHNNGGNPSLSNAGQIGEGANDLINQAEGLTDGVRNRNSGSGEVQTLSMEWLLFDFGKREAIINAAKQAQLANNILFTAAHQKVIYDVTLAFYTHAAAAARVVLVQQAVTNAHSVQAAAEMRLKQGQGTIVDVTQARQMTAQAELRLVQAQNAAENTYLNLMTAMGISPNTRLQTTNVSNRALTMADARLTDDMVRQAVAQRPDVLAAYASAKASQSRIAAAKADFLPKVFVSGNVAYSTGQLALSSVPGVGSDSSPTLNLSTNNFSSLILGGITVPVFDGGMRAAVLRQVKNQADSAQTLLRKTVDESVKQIIVAENSLHASLSAYTAATKLLTASQTAFDAAFAAYRNGVGSITQATMAQTGLLDAQLGKSDAYYASLIAASSLAFATGSIQPNPPA